MALKRSAAASPPCSTSEVCFASRRPRSAAASPHGRVPCGGSAPLVPLFLCRAVGASSKLKGGARKVGGKSFVGAPSRGGLRERKTSCRRLFNADIAPPGAILQSARALFSRRATPHAAQMEGRSRGTPPTRPAAVRPWPPASASSVGRRSLGSPTAPSKIHGLGIFLGVFRG